MTRKNISELREKLTGTLNRVARRRERIVVQTRGKDIAVLIPLEDLELLEKIEDRIDIDDAREALKDPGSIPWEELKKKLGL